MQWPAWCFNRLTDPECGGNDKATDKIANFLEGASYRTCFSGIDAPGVAINMVEMEIERRLGRRMQRLTHSSAVEVYGPSQAELVNDLNPSKPAHLFKDMTDFLVPELKAEIKKIKGVGGAIKFQDLLPAIKSGRAVRRRAFCLVHKAECRVERCRMCWSGTPCVAWSSMGSNKGENDDSIICFMAWAGLQLEVEDDYVIHENVDRFDPKTLELTLGSKYEFRREFNEILSLSPVLLGWPSERKRAWRARGHAAAVCLCFWTTTFRPLQAFKLKRFRLSHVRAHKLHSDPKLAVLDFSQVPSGSSARPASFRFASQAGALAQEEGPGVGGGHDCHPADVRSRDAC